MNQLSQAVPLLPYQERWVRDDSKLKLAVKARQTGFSFAATLRAVLGCLERKLTWILLSKGERQSKLLMEKVQDHVKAIGVAAQYYETSFAEANHPAPLLGKEGTQGWSIKQLEVRFPNGSVIYGLPANPDTARGYSGNVTLDEFAFHQDAAKIFAALYPTITRGYSLEVISTPNGTQGKFYELAKGAGLIEQGLGTRDQGLAPNPQPPAPATWSAHRVDIYEAIQQGFPVNADELRAGVDDEDTWLQEYCCEFISDAQNYIPMELIMGCISEEASTEWDVATGTPECYLGVDIGRKRDLTIAWLFEKVGDVLWSREMKVLQGQAFDTQEKVIDDLIEKFGPRRVAVDQSGLGMMLAEHLAKQHPGTVEPVQFTAQVKERLAPLVKAAFENRTVRIPDHREIRNDVNAVKRFVTPAGNIRFDAEHTDKGHADRFWALALALNAAARPPAHFARDAALMGEPVAAGMMEAVF